MMICCIHNFIFSEHCRQLDWYQIVPDIHMDISWIWVVIISIFVLHTVHHVK